MYSAPLIAEPPTRLITGAWIGCAAAVAATVVVVGVSRTPVEPGSLAFGAGLLAIPCLLYLVYSHLRPDRVIAAVGGALTVIGVVAFAASILGLAALRLRMPLVDSTLASADAAIGLTSPDLVVWLARHKAIGDMLDLVYRSMSPLMFIIIPLLALMRQTRRLWEMAFVFAGTAVLTALTSVFFPAIGAIVHYNISPEILAQLPAGAGRFYVPTFEAFRSGTGPTIDLSHLEGVVTFPSFHAIAALFIAHAWRGLPGATLFKIWAALVIVSAIPIGGHYLIDLFVGAALWGVFAAIANWLRGPMVDDAPFPTWHLGGAAALRTRPAEAQAPRPDMATELPGSVIPSSSRSVRPFQRERTKARPRHRQGPWARL